MVLSNKEWLDKMDEIIKAIQNNGVDSQVIMDMLSNMWSSSVTYNVGDYVLYNNNIWKCLVQNSNIAPTEGSTWTSVKITDEISTLNSNFKKSEILSKTFECTVNQNGIQALDLETDIHLALQICLNQPNYFATVRSLTSALWYVVVENYDGTRAANVTVSGTVYYVVK